MGMGTSHLDEVLQEQESRDPSPRMKLHHKVDRVQYVPSKKTSLDLH